MKLRPIDTEADYPAALREVSAHFDNEPGTLGGDRFADMLARIEAYEAQRFPVDPPSP